MYERRLSRLVAVFGVLLLVLFCRAFALQVVEAERLLRSSPAAGTTVLPRRGAILWADGRPMVENAARWTAFVSPRTWHARRGSCAGCGRSETLPEPPKPGSAASERRPCPECGDARSPVPAPAPDREALARLLGVPSSRLPGLDVDPRSKDCPAEAALLAPEDRLTAESAATLAARAAEFPGIGVRPEAARIADPIVANVVGAARPPYREDIDLARAGGGLADPGREERGLHVYRPEQIARLLIGATRLERQFDERLRGIPGRVQRLPPARGTTTAPDPIVHEPVVDGDDVRTTLARDVQAACHGVVSRSRGTGAAAVAMDVRDGAILGIAARSDDAYFHGVAALQPGSVYKLVTALAALEAGVADRIETRCERRGHLPGGQRYVCHSTHGDQRLEGAFAGSCNPWFHAAALALDGRPLADAARRLGLDDVSAVGLGPPARGVVSDWTRQEAYLVAIGQGRALASPLQIATAFGRVAAGGRKIVPFLDRDAGPPRGSSEVDPVIARHAARLASLAADVVDRGTAASVPRLAELRAAGKSGTAEIRSRELSTNNNNAWFVAWAPREAPRVVVCVVHERVELHGGANVGPDVAEILEVALRAR